MSRQKQWMQHVRRVRWLGWSAGVALLAAGVFWGGCFVDDADNESGGTATVHLVLDLDFELRTFADGRRKSHDNPVDLTENPLLIQVMLDAQDIAAPVTDRWIGQPEAADTVELSLEAPAGFDRELSVVVYYWTGQQVETYKAFQSGLELGEGDQVVTLTPELSETWVLEGLLLNPGETVPSEVTLEDVQSGARFPAVGLTEEGNGWAFEIKDIPTGRFFYLRLRHAGGWEDPLYYCPIFFGQSAHIQRTIDLEGESC